MKAGVRVAAGSDLRISSISQKQFERLLSELVAVYDSAYQGGPQRTYRTRHPTDEYLRWLYKGDPRGFFVAWEGRHIVGFASMHGEWTRDGKVIAELHELAVRQEAQGRGVGTRLLERALAYARELGRSTVGLWVGEHNYRAARLYKRYGFRRVGTWNEWVRMEMSVNALPVSATEC